MTRKIFYSIFSVCVAVFLLSLVLTFTALYTYFSGIEESRLEDNYRLVEQGIEAQGEDYLKQARGSEFRLTLIEPDGTVVFDSQADPSLMENHAGREEVRLALENGAGKSSRYSDTLTERAFYYAGRLADGNILRISASSYSVLALFMGIFPPLILIFLGALVLSMFLATRLSKKIVAPLNELDLDHPEQSRVYDELDPLMLRLSLQQKQIRDQKHELADRAREFTVISEAISEGLVLIGPKLNIITMNPAAKHIFHIEHWPENERFVDLCPCVEIRDMVEKSIDGKRISRVVDWENEAWMTEVSPVMHHEKFQGCVLLIMNVTDQQKAEEMRREFTGNVSHELKTPLQTISGYSELMSSGMVDEKDVPAFSGKILQESKRMTALINEILTLSYLDETTSQDMEQIDLYDLASGILAETAYQANREGITASLHGDHVRVEGNRAMIRSILFNLIDNASKYNRPHGSVDVVIGEQEIAGEKQAVIRVEDTGLGIPAADQERIFERFYRVDKSRSRAKGGTGLGLSIVKHALRLHNGQIELSSTPDQGSVFTVILPVHQNNRTVKPV